jgi:hypothetical protein
MTLTTNRLQYGTPAKVLHWVVLALLAVQFPIGWFMPDVHGGPPGRAMTFHISFGITILALTVLRFVWRLSHPRGTRKFVASVAESFIGGGTLASVRSRPCYDHDRLAVRLVPRLVSFLFLSPSIAYAGLAKSRGYSRN